MAYIGKQPLVGNYQVLDALTATATDTYALTKNSVAVFPQTPANCIVSLNGVIQAPYDSYTISGSNIVFASALTASDSIDFITVLGDVLNVGTVSDGTIGLAKLSATGTKDATTFLRGDNTFQTIGTNTPAFLAKLSSDQSISDNTLTKVQFDTEDFDTNSNYDNATNYRFTPTVAGKYFVYASVWLESNSNTNFNRGYSIIKKNGSTTLVQSIQDSRDNPTGAYSSTPSIVVSMNGTTDYLEVQAFIVAQTYSGIIQVNGGSGQSFFGAYKIIE